MNREKRRNRVGRKTRPALPRRCGPRPWAPATAAGKPARRWAAEDPGTGERARPPPRPPTLTFHHLHPPHNLPAGAARYNPRSVAAPYSAALSSSCPAAACPVSVVPSRGLGPPCTTPCSFPALRPALRPVASPGQTHPGYDYYLKRGASCVVSPRTVYTVVTGVVRNMIPEGGWCVFFFTNMIIHMARICNPPV